MPHCGDRAGGEGTLMRWAKFQGGWLLCRRVAVTCVRCSGAWCGPPPQSAREGCRHAGRRGDRADGGLKRTTTMQARLPALLQDNFCFLCHRPIWARVLGHAPCSWTLRRLRRGRQWQLSCEQEKLTSNLLWQSGCFSSFPTCSATTRTPCKCTSS